MAKSWKKLVKTTDSDSNTKTGGEAAFNNIQLTLEEISSQNQELNHLLKERQSLENEMGDLLQSSNPVSEDPRFAGSIESFKNKREKEKNRTAQKKKLEERILNKNKELEKWEKNQQRLKEKLAFQKKSLQKKETEQDPSTSLKASKSTKESSGRLWSETNSMRKKKDVIEKVKKVQTEYIDPAVNVSEKIKERKAAPDTFGQKDLVKFRKKLDQVKTPKEIPTRIRTIKDDWLEKREAKQEELKEKISLQKLSDKLEEMKRFSTISKPEGMDLPEFPEPKLPDIKELTDTLEKEISLDDRQNKASENASAKKAEQKENEQKETERRERRKEGLLSRKKAERKEEERFTRMKERKKDKYT